MSADRIVQVIDEAPDNAQRLALLMNVDRVCAGSKFHSPKPLLVRPYYLSDEVARMAQEATLPLKDDLVHLCATCVDNLAVYLFVLWSYDGATPRAVRRDFGNPVRALGDRAWAHHMKRSTPVPV